MKKSYLPALCVLLHFGCVAQSPRWSVQASLFNNATLLPPGKLNRIFAGPLHPGVSLGTTFTYSRKGRHQLLQTAQAGYYHHRYLQHGIQLYTQAGYRYHTRSGFDVGPLVGGGYMHSLPIMQTFGLNNRGEYGRKNRFGRSHAMFSAALEVGYATSSLTNTSLRFFLNYQFWLQASFINQYVPLLPNTAVHLGVSVPLRKRSS